MAKDPVVHSSPLATGSRFQVESVAGRVTVSTLGDKLTGIGLTAVQSALGTYYSSTITPTQVAALKNVTGDLYTSVSACEIFAAAAPGTEATLAAALVTAMKTAGATVAG